MQNIADAMAKADSKNAKHYERNAENYAAKLDALDAKIRSELSTCQKDTFVPFHNAFTYFAKRYDLHAESLVGLSPEVNPSPKEIEDLIHFAKEHNVKYFFHEEFVNKALADKLAQELGGAVLLFSPIEGLSEEEQKNQVTYIQKMEDNLDNLKIALKCN